MIELVLKKSDYQEFRLWLNLNLDGLTWQGRFKKEFEYFWTFFFEDDLKLSTLAERFEYAYSEVRIGSLSSWFLWLRDRFICYVFFYKNISIEEISSEMNLPLPVIGTILRCFLVDEYPHLDLYLSDRFQVGNILSPNVGVTFSELNREVNISVPSLGSREDEIMPSMEVTLFDEWNIFIKKMKSDFEDKKFNLKSIRDRASFVKQMRVLQEVGALFLLFALVMFFVQKGNVWYEKYLMDKVSIYEPKFSWLNKSLVFKSNENRPSKEFKLNFDDIKDITKGEKLTEFFDPEKYEEETEVTLTSFDSIPKDFTSADKEPSQYEGDSESPNGYRETKNGTTKIYRLMMSATNTYLTRDKLNNLANKYQVEAVGDSTPGMDVPGGVYYNVYIPRKDFKEFMTEAMKLETSKLFESNTSNVKSEPGKIRVFIMVKSI